MPIALMIRLKFVLNCLCELKKSDTNNNDIISKHHHYGYFQIKYKFSDGIIKKIRKIEPHLHNGFEQTVVYKIVCLGVCVYCIA